MGKQQPSIPKGTRDFLPQEAIRRKHIFSVIENTYLRYGYRPIETPAMELMSTLTGKYGDEGDKLLFRILNSGDYLGKVDPAMLDARDSQQLAPLISEKGLRYDLTVPFARFVAQHRNELTFPFRRYQIQPVWRADRPQKGRYREFFQCDADVIGSDSLINEAELVRIIEEVFEGLKIRVVVRLNNRKVLAGMAAYMGRPEMLTSITIALDKWDKVGEDGVRQELGRMGLGEDEFERMKQVIAAGGHGVEGLKGLEDTVGTSEIGMQGVEELRSLASYLQHLQVPPALYRFDLSLARGLDYYTGTIIEVTALDHAIGSICGGGRYDDLTGIFGLEGVSGVGISFGADRIYDVMEALNLFPDDAGMGTRLLFLNFGGEEEAASLRWLARLRAEGIVAEIFPDATKITKQMAYAHAMGIPYVCIIGEEERREGTATLKEMAGGSQKRYSQDELINYFGS